MARVSGEASNHSSSAREDVGPDSSHLRISTDTKHESGIPPARESLVRGQEQLEHTLSEIARTEANLQSLVRGLRHLTAGANAALESTGSLVSEFDALRELFALGNAGESKLRATIVELSAALERTRTEARAELRQLAEQDDRFLAELLNDHECELRALEQHLVESAEKRNGEAIAELTAQRDQARAYALRCELERDLAWQDLGVKTPAPRVNTPSPAPAEVKKKTPIGTLKLRPNELGETTPEPKPTTRRSAEYSLVDPGEEQVSETKPGLASPR